MLKWLVSCVVVFFLLLGAWFLGTMRASPEQLIRSEAGGDRFSLTNPSTRDAIRGLAPHVASVPRERPVSTRPVARTAEPRPVKHSASVSYAAPENTPIERLLPKAPTPPPAPEKKSSKWVKHLSGQSAQFTLTDRELSRKPCHGGFGENCARASDDRDIKVVGVIMETNDGRPVADKLLTGDVKKGNYDEGTPAIYVK
jgi:hypothetical protein